MAVGDPDDWLQHARSDLRAAQLARGAVLSCGVPEALERSKNYPRAHELASRCVAHIESGANPTELRYRPSGYALAYAYGLQARLSARVGRKDEAGWSIAKAESINNDFQTRYSRASIHYIEGSWEQALQVLREAYAQAKGR